MKQIRSGAKLRVPWRLAALRPEREFFNQLRSESTQKNSRTFIKKPTDV